MEKDRGFPLSIFAWFGYALPLAESLGKSGPPASMRFSYGGATGSTGYLGSTSGARPPERARGGKRTCPVMTAVTIYGCPEKRGRAAAGELIACVEDCAAAEVKTLVVHLTDGAAPPPCSPLGPYAFVRCRDGRAAGRPAGIRKSAPSAAFEAGTRYLRQPGRRSMLRQRPPSWVGPGNGLAFRIRVPAVCPPPPRQRRDTGQPRRPF